MIATKQSATTRSSQFSLQQITVSVTTDSNNITLTTNEIISMTSDIATGKRTPVYASANSQTVLISDLVKNANGTVLALIVNTSTLAMLPPVDITDKVYSKFDPLTNSHWANGSFVQAGYILVDSNIINGYVVYLGNMIDSSSITSNTTVIPDAQCDRVGLLYSYLVPSYKIQDEKNALRLNLLASLDVANSISYLEVQNDFLTNVVVAMYHLLSTDQQTTVSNSIPRFSDFVSNLQTVSIFNIKSVDDCLDEITENKQEAYTKLSNYYKAKALITN